MLLLHTTLTEKVDPRGWSDMMQTVARLAPETAEDIRNKEMQALVDAAKYERGSGR